MKTINAFGRTFDVPADINYLAQDHGGQVWGYSHMPVYGINGSNAYGVTKADVVNDGAKYVKLYDPYEPEPVVEVGKQGLELLISSDELDEDDYTIYNPLTVPIAGSTIDTPYGLRRIRVTKPYHYDYSADGRACRIHITVQKIPSTRRVGMG